jgi:enamine deaminase RidA (YjgF/YER057c/UK114 family)
MKPSEKLKQLGIALPAVAKPIGSYVPALWIGNLVYISGQLPMREGKLIAIGKVPAEIKLEDAAAGARKAAINAVAAAADVIGGVDNIARVVHCRVYVSSSAGFTDQPKVANGASNVLADIFGGEGRHARAAVGVSELPMNAAVELEIVFQTATELPAGRAKRTGD